MPRPLPVTRARPPTPPPTPPPPPRAPRGGGAGGDDRGLVALQPVRGQQERVAPPDDRDRRLPEQERLFQARRVQPEPGAQREPDTRDGQACLTRELALRGRARKVGKRREPETHRLLPALPLGGLVAQHERAERDEQPDELLLAHLHGAAETLVRGRVLDDRVDEVGPPDDEAGALRPPDRLAAAEDREVRAFVDEAAQVLAWQRLGGGVHDDGHSVCVGDPDDGAQVGGAQRQLASGKEQHRGRLVLEGALELPLEGLPRVADVDDPRLRGLEQPVIRVALTAEGDDAASVPGARVDHESPDRGQVRPGHAGPERQHDARRGPRRDVRRGNPDGVRDLPRNDPLQRRHVHE